MQPNTSALMLPRNVLQSCDHSLQNILMICNQVLIILIHKQVINVAKLLTIFLVYFVDEEIQGKDNLFVNLGDNYFQIILSVREQSFEVKGCVIRI